MLDGESETCLLVYLLSWYCGNKIRKMDDNQNNDKKI